MTDKLSQATAENVLTLLCTNTEAAKKLSSFLTPDVFESEIYRRICEVASDFIEQFDRAPKEHLPDILEKELTSDNRKADLYRDVIFQIEATKEYVHERYVMDQIGKFIRLQQVKSVVMEAAGYCRDGLVEEAEEALNKAFKKIDTTQDLGLRLTETRALDFLHNQADVIPLGIPALDGAEICPVLGELSLFLAPPNRGKTWFMLHCGKRGLLTRRKVLHISLEMSEKRMAERYVMGLLGLPKYRKKEDQIIVRHFLEQGDNFDFEEVPVQIKRALRDPDSETELRKKLDRIRFLENLIIKQFPTNSLSPRELTRYLDTLERSENFVPDLMLVDYADLMKLKGSDVRTETGMIYKELREIAVERGMAIVTASQTNRIGDDAKLITMKHLAEDFSKAGICDNIITFNQTKEEKLLGLARLYAAKGRNEEAQFVTFITQCYSLGQFVTDSIRLKEQVENAMETLGIGGDGEDKHKGGSGRDDGEAGGRSAGGRDPRKRA